MEIAEGSLLYHAVHGLCRVDEITREKQSGKEVLCYSLVPKTAHRMKARFIIAAAGMEGSGFHTLVSPKEANKILDYLKAGNKKAAAFSQAGQNQAWDFARALLSFAHEKFEAKDPRKRQLLERSARGLVGELSLVFKMSLKESADNIRKNLRSTSSINPSVLLALAQAGGGD